MVRSGYSMLLVGAFPVHCVLRIRRLNCCTDFSFFPSPLQLMLLVVPAVLYTIQNTVILYAIETLRCVRHDAMLRHDVWQL